MTTISIRIDEKLKKAAGKTLASLGLDTSSAVKMFLSQVVTENGLPFTPSKDPAKIRARWDKEVAEALKNGKRYLTAEEMHKDIFKV